MRNGEATTKRARMRFISTQMFGERRHETLPMRDCKHSTATKRAKLKYFAPVSAEHRREGGWYLALPDAGNGTTKNACPYQNKFGEKF